MKTIHDLGIVTVTMDEQVFFSLSVNEKEKSRKTADLTLTAGFFFAFKLADFILNYYAGKHATRF